MRPWALIASVALNVFLLGFILGDFARPIRAAQSLGDLAAHYPDTIRDEIRANIVADRSELQAALAAFNATRAELFAAMREPELDRAQVEALMGRVREETTKMQTRLQAAVLAAVANAPAELRAEIGTPQLGDRAVGFGWD